MTDFHAELTDRLIRYAAIDSQSNEDAPAQPSTAIQLDILRLLEQELIEIGATEVQLTDYGTVLATIPGTAAGPTIGLLAHVDTAPQFNATGVKPRLIKGYNGGEISFPDNPNLSLSPADFPYLATKQGHDIVTASGLTLLGADDKAGVAIIMTAARHLLANPDIPHPPLRIAFTPDEEIGRGVDARLPKDLKADFAYTFDGGAVGEIEYESFSADGAMVKITGVSIHPGLAKGKLVNALHLAAKIINSPARQPDPGKHRGSAGLHPPHRPQRLGRRMLPALHPARFRTRRARRQRRFAATDLRRHRRHRTHRQDRGDDQTAIPQHALLVGDRHDPGRSRPRRRPRVGDRARLGANPRRHRRFAPDRNGRAHPQPVHRHAKHPRPARMGLGARHGHSHPTRPDPRPKSRKILNVILSVKISHGGAGV